MEDFDKKLESGIMDLMIAARQTGWDYCVDAIRAEIDKCEDAIEIAQMICDFVAHDD